jgi:F-type H+-transporting ATPase subunit b
LDILTDAHFWVGVALVVFIVILVMVGVPGMAMKAIDARGVKVQAQLDEANRLREEAQALLADITAQREQAERHAAEVLANARDEARRLQADAQVKLAEQIERRGQLAERRIATAEAQAAAEVKAAAADLASQLAEDILKARLAGATSDPLVDQAIGQISSKLQ